MELKQAVLKGKEGGRQKEVIKVRGEPKGVRSN
jgi:hypothetical protein